MSSHRHFLKADSLLRQWTGEGFDAFALEPSGRAVPVRIDELDADDARESYLFGAGAAREALAESIARGAREVLEGVGRGWTY